MLYPDLVYNLLLSGFWNITAALPTGSTGTRQPVGVPETIPEKTFISRQLQSGDGFPTAQMNHLNGFIQIATQFHTTYGLAPITVNSFEDIVNRHRTLTAQIERIRLVSHGNDSFLFFPIFNGGLWSYGMHTEYLRALKDSDEDGLRYVIAGDPPSSPTLIDGVSQIVSGMTSFNVAVVTPLGSPPSAAVQKFIEVVNDLYQVQNGTIAVETGNPVKTLITAAQQTTLNTSLGLIEASIRAAIAASGSTVTPTQLDAFKTAVLAATPVQLEFLGSMQNLGATVLADVQTALAAAPRVEGDIRTALVGSTADPLFLNYLDGLVSGLNLFNPSVLTLGGTAFDTVAAIQGNSDVEAFFNSCMDLHFVKNGPVSINNTPATPAQRISLRGGVLAISDIIRTRISGTPGTTITAGKLNALRTAIENLPLRKSAITGGRMTISPNTFTELNAANRAMNDHFRTKLDHFRGLMQAADASKIDIRGCLVGKTPAFLMLLRDFWGGMANKPTVNAPEWFQIFGFELSFHSNATVYGDIDTLANTGIPAKHIDDTDVTTSIIRWRALIDFDAHYDFITALFAGNMRDFATLGWGVWQTGGTGPGIPVLKMEAKRVDDLTSLSLGDLVERFRVIFEVAAGSAPNATVRGKLTQLQPHLVTFKTKSDAVAAGPAPAALPQLFTDLTGLSGSIAPIIGVTPASLAPASNSLSDIQFSVTNIGTNVDMFLNGALGAFFTAVQVRVGQGNARLRYYYTIGLPLVLQGASHPSSFVMTIFASGANATEQNGIVSAALKSWMRIQWTGTPAQIAAMNTMITAMAITNDTQRNRASQWAMVAEDDPANTPTTDAGLSPTQDFRNHLVTRP